MKINLDFLCKNLKLLRNNRGFSQEELAYRLYIARTTYSAYETGAKIPDLQTLDALSSIYGVGFESMVRYDLSAGIMNRIYFEDRNGSLAKIVSNYESLSMAAKNIVEERLDILLEREAVFYGQYTFYDKYVK